jgi:hypothetical protein
VAIIDIAHERGLCWAFRLDTGRLNEETYEVADALVAALPPEDRLVLPQA